MSNPPVKPPASKPQPNFPPEPPQERVIQYGDPRLGEPGPPRNSVGKFFLRMLIGLFLGGGSIFFGWFLVRVIEPERGEFGVVLFFAPFVAMVTAMTVLAFRRRKYGYVTGILLAPVIIIAGLVALLLMICGGFKF
jgi:hypothetical protein